MVVKCQYPKRVALQYYNKHKDEFQTQEWVEEIPSPVGKLQREQADLQENINYESLEKGVAKDYSMNSFIPLGMMLNDVHDWEDKCRFIGYDFGDGFVMPVLDFDKENDPNYNGSPWVDMSMPQESDMLSTMIDKSPRVANDSIVYRYGELPLDIQVGEHGVIKGFQSTSYNPFIAFKDIPEGGGWLSGKDKEVRYKQRIFVMNGTKGMVLNNHTGCVDWQSELLLDKGMRYVVLAKNDNDMTADILVY